MESLIIESLAPPQHMAKKHKCLDDRFAEEQYGKFLTAARVSSELGGQSLVTNRKQKWHVFLTSCQSVYR